MKYLVVLLIALVSHSINAQKVNGVPIDEIDAEYVQIVGTNKLFSSKVTVEIDFG